MVRRAMNTDIPALAALMADAYQRSIYVDRAGFDVRAFKALCVQSIQRHGQAGDGGCCVFVHEAASGQVDAFVMGVLQRIYMVGDRLSATDLFFIAAPFADPRAAPRLIDRFHDWAASNPAVIEVRMGATDAVGKFERTEKLYRRRRMTQSGVIYTRRLDL